ncbi:MAG: zf-HC2 domain-containing protein, partial [Caldicoprobacterales bacterium]
MIENSCQVCRDLIPLVKDNVASEESRKLVLEHIRQCGACKDEYENGYGTLPEMDDERVLQKIKRRLFF